MTTTYRVRFRLPRFPEKVVLTESMTKEDAQLTAVAARKEGYLKVDIVQTVGVCPSI